MRIDRNKRPDSDTSCGATVSATCPDPFAGKTISDLYLSLVAPSQTAGGGGPRPEHGNLRRTGFPDAPLQPSVRTDGCASCRVPGQLLYDPAVCGNRFFAGARVAAVRPTPFTPNSIPETHKRPRPVPPKMKPASSDLQEPKDALKPAADPPRPP